ncbi:MAG: phytanoyl-CoA dioxygenase [Dehalococcoidia bacterium]|nr:phytanoyl-CoA dioxygenase [Dehalococcoidia bacterium]
MQYLTMSEDQQNCLETNGYLVVPRALDTATVERLTTAADRLFEQALRDDRLNQAGAFELRNCITHDYAFLPLLDWPATVPLVPYILGWNIQLDTSHLIVRPPQPPDTAASFKAIDWHRDGGIANRQLPEPLPRLRLKICYVLSDLSQPGRGNTRFVPGSHKRPGQPAQQPGAIDPDGAIEVLAEPGDAVLFENRLFHAVGPNLSMVTRKTIFMGYAYRWLRPLDYVVQPPELLAKVQDDPIRWQLLGAWATEMAFSLPKDEDVPLRAWCDEHGLG